MMSQLLVSFKGLSMLATSWAQSDLQLLIFSLLLSREASPFTLPVGRERESERGREREGEGERGSKSFDHHKSHTHKIILCHHKSHTHKIICHHKATPIILPPQKPHPQDYKLNSNDLRSIVHPKKSYCMGLKLSALIMLSSRT